MKEDNIDQQIREKLEGRTIQPSTSAWERLSSQLDEVEQKKKRHWFLYVGYAASIALIVSLFLFLNKGNDMIEETPDTMFVEDNAKKPELDTTEEIKNVLPVEDNAMVANEEKEVKNKELQQEFNKKPVRVFEETKENSVIANKDQKFEPKVDVQKKSKELTQQNQTVIANIDLPKDNDSVFKAIQVKEGITVDSEALLMSVTGTREEIKNYYKKYKVNRADVLATIEKELKKSSLKVDPQTILAEVERDVNEENFQNNFYQFIKKRVSSVATAIANRNN